MGCTVTDTLARPRTAVIPLAFAAVSMMGLATWTFAAALARLIGAAAITAENIEFGITLPAAIFVQGDAGRFEIGRDTLATMYDGNGVPSAAAVSYAAGLRDVASTFHGAAFVNALVVLALAVVVMLLCIRLLRGQPFGRSLTASLAVFAGVIAAGSMLSQVLRAGAWLNGTAKEFRTDIAGLMIGAPQIPDTDLGYHRSTGAAEIDLTFVGIGVLLALVAVAFRIGEQLHSDTKGLV